MGPSTPALLLTRGSFLWEEDWDRSESWGHSLPPGIASELLEPPLPGIRSGVGLAGGGAVTQFLGGFSVLLREGGSFLDPKELLGRGWGWVEI